MKALLLLACLFVSAFAGTRSPKYIHLALTNDTSAMVASWMTDAKTTVSYVKYGTVSGNYTHTVKGTQRTYHEAAGYVHDAIMTELKPHTKYYYRCGDETAFSPEHHFTTSVNANQHQPTHIGTKVAMYADMGVKNAGPTAVRLGELVDKVDFYYHVGDISYANDYPSHDYEKIWNEWFVLMKKLMPYTPYMVAVGNHEHESGKPHLPYSEYFRVYNYRFKMPAPADNNMWFSFDYNGVHFVSLSTETDYTDAPFPEKFGDQIAWLKKDLAAASANRKNVPWLVVTGHRPMYVSNDKHPAYLKALADAVEDLLHQHKVDLYVCGHVHNYERSYPMYKGKRTSTSYVNPEAPVHIIVGNAGCPEGISHDFSKDKPEWTAYRYDEGTGYGILTVNGTSEMKWEFFTSVDGKMGDSFTIVKK